MQQIVAATDFSTRSQRAVRRAGLLARRSAAELTLVHVVDDDQPREFIDLEQREAKRVLHEQIKSLAELHDVSCRPVVTTGEAFGGILETAKSCSADLIVMGTHRKQVLRDVFVGTTIERVIRIGSYPVLMVNTAAERPYEYVLGAVDMSEHSARAIKVGQALGLLAGKHVTLIHAFIAAAKGILYIANAPEDQAAAYIDGERRRSSEELLAFLATHEIRSEGWSYRIQEGPPLEVISRVAKETMSDLVIIGTHGRSGVVKVLLGSVAEEVLRSLNIDILTVPPAR